MPEFILPEEADHCPHCGQVLRDQPDCCDQMREEHCRETIAHAEVAQPSVPCEEPGCNQTDAIACYHGEDCPDGASSWHLCPEHAVKHGYCCLCGVFSADIESFDCGRFLDAGGKRMCDSCWSSFQSAIDEADNEDAAQFDPMMDL